jgi:hypothetical protein
MAWRQIAGAIAGLVLWWVLFLVIGVGIGLLWPEYRESARVMFQERAFRLFTPPMLVSNLLVFAVAGMAAGRVSTVIARSRIAALVLAAVLLLYAIIEHYVLLWDQLPHWYNLIVPVMIAGSVWLGGRTPVFRAAQAASR